MSCLADETVAAWLDGELTAEERAAAIEHASECDACRELIASLFDGERVPVAIGRYEIAGTIGGGGMGVVLRGRDPVLDRQVAIKLARAGQGDHAQALREAQSLARLNHPNVVAVHDFGESGGEVYVVMSLVEGEPLSRWLSAAHSLGEKKRVLDGVAAGLAAIHDAGLVHRDIKPDNVIVRPNGEAAIVDFGLARGSAPGVAGSGVAGTRNYVAPEVMAGGAATPASDQYAWWILVGEVLAERTARVSRAREHGVAIRYRDMRTASRALHRAMTPRWPIIAGILGAGAIAAAAIVLTSRAPEDPCAWEPTAWTDARAAVGQGLGAAGVDVVRVVSAIDLRAATTASTRHDACVLSRHDKPEDRALGQYRIACVDQTWADALGNIRGLSSTNRDEVWAAVDQLSLVLDPTRCAKVARAIAAPVVVTDEGTRLGQQLTSIARDPALKTAERLAKMNEMEPAVLAAKSGELEARWYLLRASQLQNLGKFDESSVALDKADLAAETVGDDDLRAEVAIDRVSQAYSTGARDTAAIEARAAAIVDKLDNPVRRAELANTRGMLMAARGDIPNAVAALRETVTRYDELSLDASERAVHALQNLGAALQLAGDLEGAQLAFDKGLVLSARRFGETSTSTLEMRGARATNLLYAGRAEEARAELAIVVDGLTTTGGPRNGALNMARMMLCQAETEAKSSSAVTRCHDAVVGAEQAYGKDHPQLVAYLTLYGDALREQKQPAESVTVLERALEIAKTGTLSDSELPFAQGSLALSLHDIDPTSARGKELARAATTALAARPDMERMLKQLATAYP